MKAILVVALYISTYALCAAWQPSFLSGGSRSYPLVACRMSSINNNIADNDVVRVTVVGGTGFVGSRVCQILAEEGASVRSISKSGTVPKWCQNEEWTSKVTWSALDLATASTSSIDEAMGDPDAVVSCVGVIGTDPEMLKVGNGDANVAAFQSAKRKGATRAVFISVSSELLDCRDDFLPEFMGSYFDGKEAAEAAAVDAVGQGSVTILKPTFVYGGDSFGINPPRVTADYGAMIDQLLSFPPIQICADVFPGMVKVALRPPVSVESLAGACVAAALGQIQGQILDGTKSINAVTRPPPSTGLTDAVMGQISWMQETLGIVTRWMGQRLKEQAMSK